MNLKSSGEPLSGSEHNHSSVLSSESCWNLLCIPPALTLFHNWWLRTRPQPVPSSCGKWLSNLASAVTHWESESAECALLPGEAVATQDGEKLSRRFPWPPAACPRARCAPKGSRIAHGAQGSQATRLPLAWSAYLTPHLFSYKMLRTIPWFFDIWPYVHHSINPGDWSDT